MLLLIFFVKGERNIDQLSRNRTRYPLVHWTMLQSTEPHQTGSNVYDLMEPEEVTKNRSVP